MKHSNILTIGGLDPCGISGIYADIRTIHALGSHALAITTLVSAQNTTSFTNKINISKNILEEQLDSVFSDVKVDAITFGALGSKTSIQTLLKFLTPYKNIPKVIDPIIKSSTGGYLIDKTAYSFLYELMKLGVLITPNIVELEILTGFSIKNVKDAIKAAQFLFKQLNVAILVKGGHFKEDYGKDILVDGEYIKIFPKLIDKQVNTRGTGGVMASAIAVFLSKNIPLVEAIEKSRKWVSRLCQNGYKIGMGEGPIDCFYWNRPIFPHTIGRLHVITNTTLQNRFTHEELVKQAIDGGADSIQFREKEFFERHIHTKICKNISKICDDHHINFIVNDRVDIAVASFANGVHIGYHDLDIFSTRRILGPCGLIGKTINHINDIDHSTLNEVDYFGVGPVFDTSSKKNPAKTLGLKKLQDIVKILYPRPVIAIGGIKPVDIANIMSTGAYGIAILSGIVCAKNPYKTTQKYRLALDKAL